MKFRKAHLVFGACFLLLASVLWKSVSWRISQTYLEDDIVWFFPIIDHLLNEKNSALVLLKSFHLPELTFFDALYFAFLKFIFGYHFFLYPLASFLLHLVNGFLIYRILSRVFDCSLFTSGLAAFIYLSFYGHYHAYLWPMAMHHVLGVFWILLFLYEYLQMLKKGERAQENKKSNPDRRLYGLAFLASFMRLSVLIVPLVIGAHIVMTSSSKRDFFLRIKRWVPVFLIISWYQILVLFMGKHGDVLSGFLKTKSLILLLGVALGLWLLFRRNLQRIYYCWLIIPFVFILCLYLWLFPQNTLTPSNVAQRWQLMPLPTGATMWVFMTVLSWLIMYVFTRHVLYRHKGFGVFIIWYMLVFPYLVTRLSAMPSRYVLYVSPIFAIILAVFLGEILADRAKASHKTVFRVIIGCLSVWAAVVNIQAIHQRSIRSFVADYHWKYDDILMAQYIKNDLNTKKISAKGRGLCVQGVNRLRYLEDWAKKYLKDQKMDGYESFRITVASVLGIPRGDVRIKDRCGPEEMAYDFKDDDIFAKFMWPANFRKEDAWEIYGERFGGDSETLRIDNMLQRQVNSFDDGKIYWSLKQGNQVGRYGDFDIYDFQKWYFAIPIGESFNLARLKMGDYQKNYFAQTKYEIRQGIDSEFPDDHAENIVSDVQQGKPYRIPDGEHVFKMKLLGIPLGYLYLRNEGIVQRDGLKFYRISAELKPWGWLQKISGDRIGFKMTSLIAGDDLLPIEFEQIDLMKLRKGKQGRKIIYHHKDLFMERRGYKEDIAADTRDPVAASLWAIIQDYAGQTEYTTTLNLEKNLFFVEIIPVSMENSKTLFNVKVNPLGDRDIKYNWFLSFNYRQKGHMPEIIILKDGLTNFSFILL